MVWAQLLTLVLARGDFRDPPLVTETIRVTGCGDRRRGGPTCLGHGPGLAAVSVVMVAECGDGGRWWQRLGVVRVV
jgi:hypothetical protein